MPSNIRTCKNDSYEVSSKFDDRQLSSCPRLPNVIVFIITLQDPSEIRLRKKISVDTQLLSYSFLNRLINQLFDLKSNFTLVAKQSSSLKCNFLVADDFDVDGCLMNTIDEHESSTLEFLVYQYPRTKEELQSDNNDWYFCDDPSASGENFELISIERDSIVVSIKPNDHRQETFLQKATGWLHGSVNSSARPSLTRKEFLKMLDPSTGRLIDEIAFRQYIFDYGCDESIRKIVWCYLLRVFNESMGHQDKDQYVKKTRERYHEMRQAWLHRHGQGDPEILTLATFIEKDVRRTDRSVKFFDDHENLSQQKLFQILMTYSVYHPEPGYVQGMNDMAAALLYVIRDEALTYVCFCALMRYMAPLFHSNGVAMKRRMNLLKKTLRAIDFDLWTKIEQCDDGKLMFAYRWLLLDCKREFPFKDIFRVLETLWASLPADRFESVNSWNTDFDLDRDDLHHGQVPLPSRSSTVSSICTTLFSSRSSSPTMDDAQSQHSSFDGADSGYRDEHLPTVSDLATRSDKADHSSIYSSTPNDCQRVKSVPLGKWLTHFSNIDDEEQSSDMFTIFLCVALIEENRSSIMQISSFNQDNDDFIGTYFTRLVRQHEARQALDLARNYHRQYLLFQMRVKQLLLTEN